MNIFDTQFFRAINTVLTKYLWLEILSLPDISIILIVLAVVLVLGLIIKKTRLITLLLLIVLGVWFYYKIQPVQSATPVRVDRGRPLPKAFPKEFGTIQPELSALMEDISVYFSELETKPDIAIYPFTISGGGNPPVLALLADDFAFYYSRDKSVKLVKRWLIEDTDLNSSVADAGKKQGANYVVAGKVIPLGDQVIVSALIISVETSEITETYQRRIPRIDIENLLVEPHPPESSAKEVTETVVNLGAEVISH